MYGKKTRAFSLSTAAVLVLSALPAVSSARTIPGSIGRAANGPDNLCLPLFNSSVVNSCGHDLRVDFPLVADTFGTITARVRADGPSDSVACELSWWSGLSFRSSPTGKNTGGGLQQVSLTVTASISTDSVFIGCTLKPNGRVHTLIY
jgi:hypothetical protein